jgi:hypothetical protein
MNADVRLKTLFLNGKEVDSFDLTGDEAKDMEAAKKLLAEQDFAEARQRADHSRTTERTQESSCGSAC